MLKPIVKAQLRVCYQARRSTFPKLDLALTPRRPNVTLPSWVKRANACAQIVEESPNEDYEPDGILPRRV